MNSSETTDRGGLFVLVGGWPGSGKSTLAVALAGELSLPLLAKDEIKEALIDALGRPDTVAESQRLGAAAVVVMLRVAHRLPGGAVLDSTWFPYSLPLVRALPGRLVEVRCIVSLDLARARYRKRAAQRHAGHLDADRTERELWGEPPHALGVGPVVEVDTSGSVDIRATAASLVQRAVPTS